jgi:CRISPR/Cas system-associated exonuclease Cas4 (RecB family)
MSDSLLRYLDIVEETEIETPHDQAEQIKAQVMSAVTGHVDMIQKQPDPFVSSAPAKLNYLDSESVKNYIREYTIKDNIEHNKDRKKVRLSVTEDFCGCIRKTYLMFKDVERDFTAVYNYGKAVTSVGNTIHEIVQAAIPAYKVEYAYVIKDEFEFDLSGRIDMILNENVLVEIKTCDSKIKKPKNEHMKQIMIYATIINRFLKKELNCNITLAQLLYVVRGKMDNVIFNININDVEMDKVYRFMKKYTDALSGYLKDNKIPSLSDQFINTNICEFCYYKRSCR